MIKNIKKIEDRVAEIMRHYGFGYSEAKILATLAINGKMKAKEIAEKTGYAYSTVINTLNFLRRTGFVVKEKEEGKACLYSANLDFIKMIEDDRRRLLDLFTNLKREVKNVEKKYHHKLSNLKLKIESALNYLSKEVE